MNKDMLSKTLVMGMVIFIIGVCVQPVFGIQINKDNIISSDRSNILYVGGDGPGNYSTIQSAIDDASDGDTVFVFNGTYIENIEINRKSINLIGEDQDTTIIWGVVLIQYVRGITVSGFTFRPDDEIMQSMAVVGSSKCTFTNNTFKVIGQSFLGFEAGFLFGSTISYNTFQINGDSSEGLGIVLSFNNIITENIFIGNNNSLEDSTGINIGTSRNNIISENTFIHVGGAFEMGSAFPLTNNKNVISNNTIIHSDIGIFLGPFSSNNVVSGNNISNCSIGIAFLDNANRNLIHKNTIVDNEDYGILIISSNGNRIIANTISDSGRVGIYLPITLPSTKAQLNFFYYNNILRSSTCNAWDPLLNIWYKPIGLFKGEGNYWDDYTGADEDGDGIGDTPYIIPGRGCKDRFPFMEPVNIDNMEVETFFNGNIKSSNQQYRNMWLLRLLERFPLLQKLLQNLGL